MSTAEETLRRLDEWFAAYMHDRHNHDEAAWLFARVREMREAQPPPFKYEELRAICKRFVVEGYSGDYLENDGYELAREVEKLTMQKCIAVSAKDSL